MASQKVQHKKPFYQGSTTFSGVKDVSQHAFVKVFAQFLKKSGKVKLPHFIDHVKLGIHKELAPYDPDWYYIRLAAVARHLYIRSPAGVGAMTKIFGGRKSNGTKPSHFQRGSASIARKTLQTLETLKMVDKDANGGRRLTATGRRDMDRIAMQMKSRKKQEARKASSTKAKPAKQIRKK